MSEKKEMVDDRQPVDIENGHDLKIEKTKEDMAQEFAALQGAITTNHEITPEENARIRRKVDTWYVWPRCCSLLLPLSFLFVLEITDVSPPF